MKLFVFAFEFGNGNKMLIVVQLHYMIDLSGRIWNNKL